MRRICVTTKSWLCGRFTSGLDAAQNWFIGLLLTSLFVVGIAAPYIETRVERIVERERVTVREELGIDPALWRRFNLWLDQEGVPR